MFEKLSANVSRPLASYIDKHKDDKKLSARSLGIINASLARSLADVRQTRGSDLLSAVTLLRDKRQRWAQDFIAQATNNYSAAMESINAEATSHQVSETIDFLLYDAKQHGSFKTFPTSHYWPKHVQDLETAITRIRNFLASQCGAEDQPDASPLDERLENGFNGLTRILVKVGTPSSGAYTPQLFNQTKTQLMEIVGLIGKISDSQMALNLRALLDNCQLCAPGAINAVSDTLADLKLCLSNEGEISATTLSTEYAAALQANIETQIKALIFTYHRHWEDYDRNETHLFQIYRYFLGSKNIPGLPPRPKPTDPYACGLEKDVKGWVPHFSRQVTNALASHQHAAFKHVTSRIDQCLNNAIKAKLPPGWQSSQSTKKIPETDFHQYIFPALEAFSKKFPNIFQMTDLYGVHQGPDEDSRYYVKPALLFLAPYLSETLAKDPTQVFATPYAIDLDNTGSTQLKICNVSGESWIETRPPKGQPICDLSTTPHLPKVSPRQLRSALLAKYPHKGKFLLQPNRLQLNVDSLLKNFANRCVTKERLGVRMSAEELFPPLPKIWANIADPIADQ